MSPGGFHKYKVYYTISPVAFSNLFILSKKYPYSTTQFVWIFNYQGM